MITGALNSTASSSFTVDFFANDSSDASLGSGHNFLGSIAAVTPAASERLAAIAEFGAATTSADVPSRTRALRRVAENSTLTQREFNRAFVLMQYFGYLQRDANASPDADFTGYNFWLTKLDSFGGDYRKAEMVKAFSRCRRVSGEVSEVRPPRLNPIKAD